MSKISKNIKMLEILSSGKKYTCKELSKLLEISPRVVRLYKDELEKEGIYIESIMGKNGGYKLYSKIELPFILFNEYDALFEALSISCFPSISNQEFPIYKLLAL